ncbi:MAG: hypothetical protein M1824_000105 [Vezdaea acicularis]|nr:MAG: hypothetical protein M1824_000105 [Vezdaea acicularis]
MKHGRPPLTPAALLSSANFTLSLLPIRLAHRILALRNLPYIVVSNPHIARIYSNYLHSFSTLLPYANRSISSLEDEIQFTAVLTDLVQTHSNTIPILARGFLECRKYVSPEVVTRFLEEHLRARIGTRLIAEQHIALHNESTPSYDSGSGPTFLPDPSHYIGVIDTQLHPSTTISTCASLVSEICDLQYGTRPQLRITGDASTTFAYPPVHLEYMITELLKNAFRATIESGNERHPVEVTIAAAPELDPVAPHPPPPAAATTTTASTTTTTTTPDDTSSSSSTDHEPWQHSAWALTVSDANAHKGLGEDALPLLPPPSTPHSQHPPHPDSPGVTIRIRDRGRGISPANLARIWGYSFTTFSDEDADEARRGADGLSPSGAGVGSGTSGSGSGAAGSGLDALNKIVGPGGGGTGIAGLGYGLPLSRAYAEYFGGGIRVQSLWGWGTDVYLSLRGVGRAG